MHAITRLSRATFAARPALSFQPAAILAGRPPRPAGSGRGASPGAERGNSLSSDLMFMF